MSRNITIFFSLRQRFAKGVVRHRLRTTALDEYIKFPVLKAGASNVNSPYPNESARLTHCLKTIIGGRHQQKESQGSPAMSNRALLYLWYSTKPLPQSSGKRETNIVQMVPISVFVVFLFCFPVILQSRLRLSQRKTEPLTDGQPSSVTLG